MTEAGDDRRPPRRLTTLVANPFVLGAVLALIATNMSTARPVAGIDSSFRVGLTEAVLRRMEFGVDIAWPYGPLGYLGGPTIISRGLLAVAIAYQLAALDPAVRRRSSSISLVSGSRRIWSVLVLAPFALGDRYHREHGAEGVLACVVLVLVVLWQDERPDPPSPTAWWVLTIVGFVAGAQLLVKFGPGAIACAVVVSFAVAAGHRVRQLAIAVAAIAAGSSPVVRDRPGASALGPFFRTSLEISSGYQHARPSRRSARG